MNDLVVPKIRLADFVRAVRRGIERPKSQARYQRRTSSEEGAERMRANSRAYRKRNPDKIRKANRAWRDQNQDRVRELRTAWGKANPDKVRAMGRRWRLANPEKVKLYHLKYHWSKCTAPGFATEEQIAARVEFFGGVCSYCGGPYEHLDHAIAVSRGGTNWPANLRPACESCNHSKKALSAKEFIERRGRLTDHTSRGIVSSEGVMYGQATL